MRQSGLSFVAIVVLSLHVLPLGLPLFCETDRHCDQQMPMPMASGPSLDLASDATTCATALFCAVTGTAALVLSPPVTGSVSNSYMVVFDVSSFAPSDPPPPPQPPPLA